MWARKVSGPHGTDPGARHRETEWVERSPTASAAVAGAACAAACAAARPLTAAARPQCTLRRQTTPATAHMSEGRGACEVVRACKVVRACEGGGRGRVSEGCSRLPCAAVAGQRATVSSERRAGERRRRGAQRAVKCAAVAHSAARTAPVADAA